MKRWPAKHEPVSFADITKPLRTTLDGGKYEGYDIGDADKAGCPSPTYHLSPKGLRENEEQGRDRTDVVLMIAARHRARTTNDQEGAHR